MLPEQAGGDVVVAVAEDGGGDGDAIAEEAARGEEAAVDLGLDLFDDDSSTAFGRFHFVPFPGVHCIFISWREVLSPISAASSILPKCRLHQPKEFSIFAL